MVDHASYLNTTRATRATRATRLHIVYELEQTYRTLPRHRVESLWTDCEAKIGPTVPNAPRLLPDVSAPLPRDPSQQVGVSCAAVTASRGCTLAEVLEGGAGGPVGHTLVGPSYTRLGRPIRGARMRARSDLKSKASTGGSRKEAISPRSRAEDGTRLWGAEDADKDETLSARG